METETTAIGWQRQMIASLSVDYDSELEDSLETDIDDYTYFDPKEWAERLGYGDDPSALCEIFKEGSSQWTSAELEKLRQDIRELGMRLWLRWYTLYECQPIRKLLFGLGVILSKEQNDLEFENLWTLLKAAAFRIMRRREERSRIQFLCPLSETLDAVAKQIKSSERIIILSGAGISVSCGIPDFRSQNGLYSQLYSCEEYDLDDPQQMFDINFFKRNPAVFYSFAHKIYPSNVTPSPCHNFIRALEKHGKLLRNYTQNIDGLEAKAGIKRVFQCHGSFATATCINCHLVYKGSSIRKHVLAQQVPLCPNCNRDVDIKPKKIRRKKKKKRNDGWESDEPEEITPPLPPGIIKPDIIFFGEKLARKFDENVLEDIEEADLVIVIGTSLKVRPVSEIISHMPHDVCTIVINKTPLPDIHPDYQLLGDADVIVKHLARKLGWNIKRKPHVSNAATSDATNDGQSAPSVRTRPTRVKETGRRKTNITVIGKSGVLLFQGAEGGEYVNKLIARRKAEKLGPEDPDGIVDVELTDLSDSEDGDAKAGPSDNDEGPPSKKARISL